MEVSASGGVCSDDEDGRGTHAGAVVCPATDTGLGFDSFSSDGFDDSSGGGGDAISGSLAVPTTFFGSAVYTEGDGVTAVAFAAAAAVAALDAAFSADPLITIASSAVANAESTAATAAVASRGDIGRPLPPISPQGRFSFTAVIPVSPLTVKLLL